MRRQTCQKAHLLHIYNEANMSEDPGLSLGWISTLIWLQFLIWPLKIQQMCLFQRVVRRIRYGNPCEDFLHIDKITIRIKMLLIPENKLSDTLKKFQKCLDLEFYTGICKITEAKVNKHKK